MIVKQQRHSIHINFIISKNMPVRVSLKAGKSSGLVIPQAYHIVYESPPLSGILRKLNPFYYTLILILSFHPHLCILVYSLQVFSLKFPTDFSCPTAWSGIIFEKLLIAQLLHKFPASYQTNVYHPSQDRILSQMKIGGHTDCLVRSQSG